MSKKIDEGYETPDEDRDIPIVIPIIIEILIINKIKVKRIKNEIIKLAKNIKQQSIKYTEKGSIKYLLRGAIPSDQSISIKYGHLGEKMLIYMINMSSNLELLDCGIQIIDDKGKRKDIDIIWKDTKNKIIYYREAKGNIELDTEKLPAMREKINNEIKTYVESEYPDYQINIGVIVWSIYNRNELKKGITQIKQLEDQNIKVDHFEDMLKLTNIKWNEHDFYKFHREVGELLFSSS